jgi:DNA adenine methylase
VDGHLDRLGNLEADYLQADSDARKRLYFTRRDRFNALKAKRSESVELAALFIFLNKTCFNGLYRVNSRGEFNVAHGEYKNPRICDEDNLRAVSEKLRCVTVVCRDYREARDFLDAKTFAYFDPPYRPLSATANFTAYAPGGFDDHAQAELARLIDEMTDRGTRIVASNSDPGNVDARDDFFDRLYAKHTIVRVSAQRMINCDASRRGKVNELLICNTRNKENKNGSAQGGTAHV